MKILKANSFVYLCLVGLLLVSNLVRADDTLVKVISKVTQSVGAVALFTPLESQAPNIMGTGFVIGDGRYVITNYHVVDKLLDPTIVQHYVFMSGVGQKVTVIRAEVREIDPAHDLALLELAEKVPGMALAKSELFEPGTDIAFTGFPIGAVLGLYPATHKGMISAITPDAIPVKRSDQLSTKMLQRLGTTQLIYQLDATAYPGNSGSPVFLPETGEVIGVINKVIVRDTKESALSNPSGISYAVPVRHVKALLDKIKTN